MRGQRDAAIRRSAALLGQVAPSARTKALEGELLRCLSIAWLSPPADASPLRKELHRIGPLTGGDGLSWRRLVEIIEAS